MQVMAKEDDEWTPAEVSAIVDDYLAMLAAEAADQPYSKTEHRRVLMPKLKPRRTRGAVEYKHGNISAVMIGLGMPYVRGYKPYGNYQTELEDEITRRLLRPLPWP